MNTTHKHRCEDCEAFFHRPKDLEITDETGFVDLILDACPMCNSTHIAPNKDYIDKERMKQRVTNLINHMESITIGLSSMRITHTHKNSKIFICGYLMAIENTSEYEIALTLSYIRSDNAKQFLSALLTTIEQFNNLITK